MTILKKILIYSIIFIILMVYFIATFEIYKERKFILKGYKDKYEKNMEVWQSSCDFKMFYYDETFDEQYENIKLFAKVGEEIENIKRIAETCKLEEYEYEINLLKDAVSDDDYYYINYRNNNKSSFILYLYDTQEHVLYFFDLSL